MERLPSSVRERLAQDEADIVMYERKLKITGRKSRQEDDGLSELLGEESRSMERSTQSSMDAKRKSDEYNAWLVSKRAKTAHQPEPDDHIDTIGENDAGDADYDNDSFHGFSNDEADDDTPSQPRQRENPYVAPWTGAKAKAVVPSSLHGTASSEGENRALLRKRVQGQINRLTDDNVSGIVKAVEGLYNNNPRGDVTDVITDVIMAQICQTHALPIQFFVNMAGFASAIYRLIGTRFGSHLIHQIVVTFGTHYEQASKDVHPESSIPKQPLNILSLLAQLYFFEVVSSRIMFDYMGRLLDNLTELNVELLLRICQAVGQRLKKDDPAALKEVCKILTKSVSQTGYNKVSARTRVMVDTISDLSKSKRKATGINSDLITERIKSMRVQLGKSESLAQRVADVTPLSVSLKDMEQAEQRGRWWLVGASVPATFIDQKKNSEGPADSGYHSSDSEDMDIVLPDYPRKARELGLKGYTQILIFRALMMASNYVEAHKNFVNLRLKKDELQQLPVVLVAAVAGESEYNQFYALVGREACSNNKRIRYFMGAHLWNLFKLLGEPLFDEPEPLSMVPPDERMKNKFRLSKIAHFYAALVFDGVLDIAVIKPLKLTELNEWSLFFAQSFMIELLTACRSRSDSAKEDANVEKIFRGARTQPEFAAKLHWFLRKRIRKTEMASSEKVRKLKGVRQKAQAVVQAVTAEG